MYFFIVFKYINLSFLYFTAVWLFLSELITHSSNFPRKSTLHYPRTKKQKNKKDEKLSSIKRLLKIPIPGYFPSNLFPAFKVTLKVTLNPLKTSLAAIILLFFRSNLNFNVMSFWENAIDKNLVNYHVKIKLAVLLVFWHLADEKFHMW